MVATKNDHTMTNTANLMLSQPFITPFLPRSLTSMLFGSQIIKSCKNYSKSNVDSSPNTKCLFVTVETQNVNC